jgi:Concanavalin A-like lectin/glucanases superfamily/Bacterial Ig-like domain
VQFRVNGANVGSADTTSPYSFSWNTVPLPDGQHTLSAVARDAAGNTRTSANVSVTVDNDGLVAAYGFEETSGSTVTDASRDHNGTISGATRTTSGRFGRALVFDGFNDWVTIPNDSDFNLTSGLTIEAWVRPDVLGSTWRTAVMKERSSNLAYALFANNNNRDPAGRVVTGGFDLSTGGGAQLALGAWSHIAMTWGSNALRVYVNGSPVSARSTSGSLATGTGPLRIGGNSFRSEWFDGRIDEVRVYHRALSGSEIAADMNRAVP